MSLRDFMCMYSHTQESDLTYYFVAGALMNLCDAFKAKAVTDTMRGRFGCRSRISSRSGPNLSPMMMSRFRSSSNLQTRERIPELVAIRPFSLSSSRGS